MLNPTTYQSAARKLRKIADALDKRCKPKTPREKAIRQAHGGEQSRTTALTSTVHGLSRYAKELAERHRRSVEISTVYHITHLKPQPSIMEVAENLLARYPSVDDITDFILRDGRGHCVSDAAALDLAKQIKKKFQR